MNIFIKFNVGTLSVGIFGHLFTNKNRINSWYTCLLN